MHRIARTAFLAAALLLSACDSPSGGGAPPRGNPPETAPRVLALGQMVNEALESATDVDEFEVAVPVAGRGMALIAGTGTGQGSLNISVTDAFTGKVLMNGTSHGNEEGGGRFALPAGDMIVRVSSTGTTGGYRVALHAIATGPESGEGQTAFRQWAEGDMVPWYDVDEFSFDAVEGQVIKLYLQVEPGLPLLEGVLRGPGTAGLVVAHSWLWGGETEPVRIPVTGRYTVAVSTPEPAEAHRAGPYRLMIFPIVPAPEGVPAELQHAQPVNEVLDMEADVDDFTFQASEGEMFLLNAQVTPPAGRANFHLVDPATGALLLQQGLEAHSPHGWWPRWTAPHAGQYVFRALAGQSPYRLEMFRVDTRPEQVPAAIALDQTVQGEAIDPAGEVDVYELTGAAGTQVAVLGQVAPGLTVRLLPPHDTTTLVNLAGRDVTQLQDNVSERYTLPATGTYRVRVAFDRPEGSTSQGPAGAYRFRVEPIRYAPESVPAAIEFGKTVTGESLEHRADVDVFTFHAQAGEYIQLHGVSRQPNHSGHLVITIQRPGVDGSLAYVWATEGGTSAFAAPVTGVYEVRVFSAGTNTYNPLYMSTYRGPYGFTVRRGE